jgi:hypothetical protein
MRKTLLLLCTFTLLQATAQEDSTAFPQFEDVDERPVRRYATNRVLYTTPNRFISLGYEYQGAHDIDIPEAQLPGTRRFDNARGLRLAINAPVISGTRGILNVGGFYWRTAYAGGSSPATLYSPLVQQGLRSAGLNATLFKPLGEQTFLVVQGGADYNVLKETGSATGQAMTYSASAIYGWKRSDNLMWGLGASRTYRMGRLIYVPVLLYNRTFNEAWGVELLLPARGLVRRNINSKTLATLGYELEGNQYLITSITPGKEQFLQRGEIKPRLNFERNLVGFWWLAVQAGVRVNGRFVVVDRYDGKERHQLITPVLGNPFYCNISLNLVSL